MENIQLSIDEKIEKIKHSETFVDLKTNWFPQSASTSYYFVSYSHKDYKKVFVDILNMQKHDSELSVWYDRELRIGHDWEKEAKTHIYDFDCLGVIFYVSENSVESPAIFQEMQMVKDAGKPFIPILLPVENIRSKAGEYVSGAELLEILFPRLAEDDERYKLYHEMFGKNILYFKDTDSPQEKIERMKKSFVDNPLLELERLKTRFSDRASKFGAVIAVNNLYLTDVGESELKLNDDNNLPIPIAAINECAFANCKQLERIAIPNTVRKIGAYAFHNCKKLKEVNFFLVSAFGDWESDYKDDFILEVELGVVPSIGNRAFSGCSSLTSISIPKGVKSIGEGAFYDCANLTSISIPNRVETIGANAFSDCSSLTSISIPWEVRHIEANTFSDCRSLTSISILGSVKSIGENAFWGCRSLTSISIPDSVKTIGASAFGSCVNLTSISIPDSVEAIQNGTFRGCDNLTGISIPDSVKSIGEYAFEECSSLTSISIPNSVETIGARAFYGCESLTSISIPDSVETIENGTFFGCNSLTSISIPKSVTCIWMEAFRNCRSLKNILFDGTMEQWGNIEVGEEHPSWRILCKDAYGRKFGNYFGIRQEATVICTDGKITIGKKS